MAILQPVIISNLKSILANSKIQQDNNALYQTIFQLIDSVKTISDNTDNAFNTAASAQSAANTISVVSDLPHTFLLMGS